MSPFALLLRMLLSLSLILDGTGTAVAATRMLVEHVTTSNFSPHGFFSNPANQASPDFWIAIDCTVEQYIDQRMRAWAQAAGSGT